MLTLTLTLTVFSKKLHKQAIPWQTPSSHTTSSHTPSPHTPEHRQLQHRPSTMAVWDIASPLLGLLLLFHTWGAWAVVEVNMEDRVEVSRGETAQLACMFTSEDGIGAIDIMWFYTTRLGKRQQIYYQDSTMKLVERDTPFTDRISVNGTGANGGVVLTINPVKLMDELEFICHIKSLTDGTGEGRTKLRVFETPNLPTIDATRTGISVSKSGLSKIGVCEVKNGFPKPNVTWYRDNTPLHNVKDEVDVVSTTTTESSGLFSVKSELSLQVKKEDKDAEFYCEVNFFVPGETRMTETNRINITVHYPATAVSLWVESPKGEIKEGDSIEFHCSDNGNSAFTSFTISDERGDPIVDTDVMVLYNVTRRNNGVYYCNSLDMETGEEISGNTTVVVNFLDPAVVRPKETVVLAHGKGLTATCNALSSLQTQTAWFKDGKEVLKGHTLTLRNATFDTTGMYVCVVTVPDIKGMETSGTLQVNVKGPPEIKRPDNTEIEESVETSVHLSCSVRGFPAPIINWTTSDGKVHDSKSKPTDKGVQSEVSFKVTSDVTAVCNAFNEHGTDTVAFHIKATIHTTTQATTTSTTLSSTTAGGNGVIIAVLIICLLLLAILGAVLYFLYKKGKICGRSGKQDLTKEKSNKDNIVVEMKSDNTEEAILLGVNGEKLSPSDQ
ncbi:melanoma cell adhesion molecule b isoform X2 [Pleuronectes platessa]|uniref:melanoma cell adhesion molecule b isoform X2 n=1 Tax=Pleuronectes platessa TaxID=8262 RepID=UPI00232A6D8D|nr:melanoma cell adhesion molecule b isoform X2 [Pleuronectes platessa]